MGYVINASAMNLKMYSTKILKYDPTIGILTILKGGECYDNNLNSYDYCITGTVTIYNRKHRNSRIIIFK